MSTYESNKTRLQSLENIQVQIHQLSGKLDDSLRQYEIGGLIKIINKFKRISSNIRNRNYSTGL